MSRLSWGRLQDARTLVEHCHRAGRLLIDVMIQSIWTPDNGG